MSRRSPTGLKEVIRDYRRDQIVDTARRLFGERGSADVSIDEIATQAGVARSTVYVYFSGREELLQACLTRMYQLLLEAVDDDLDQHDDPELQLGAIVAGLLERIDENPAFFRLAMATQASGGRAGVALSNELATIGVGVAALLEQVVTDGIAMGRFAPVDPALAVALIGQQIFGALLVHASNPVPGVPLQRAEEITAFLVRALRP